MSQYHSSRHVTTLYYHGMFIFGTRLMSSRDAYAQLTTAPILKPLDWTRSRVRREHLISMGVPVNLDEVRFPSRPPVYLPYYISTFTRPLVSFTEMKDDERKEKLTKGRFSPYISPPPSPNYHSRRSSYSIPRCPRKYQVEITG